MQKRVHFAPTNIVYSPIPATPSPTLSEASLPSSSSSEVTTPPPEIEYSPAHHPRSPFPPTTDLIVYPHPQLQHLQQIPNLHHHHHHQPAQQPVVPQPQQLLPSHSSQQHDVILKPVLDPTHMQIHYLLAFNPLSEIPIRFDLSLHWSQLTDQVSVHELKEPATHPPLPSLIIISPLLPWRFRIKSLVTPGANVTIQDVLITLFRHLRLAVHPDEYNATDVAMRVGVDTAYHTRWSRVLDTHAREVERKKGVKRIDFLQGRNLFKGLSGTLVGADIWELNTA